MIFLLLAVFSSAMVSIVMRLSSEKITANLSMLAVNYLICSLLGAGYTRFDLLPRIPGFSVTLCLGLVSGVLYLAGLVMFQSNTRKNGIVLSSVFMKLGLLVHRGIGVVFPGKSYRQPDCRLLHCGLCHRADQPEKGQRRQNLRLRSDRDAAAQRRRRCHGKVF